MKLNELLKLPKEAQTLETIKSYLLQPLSAHDYEVAFTFYLDICQSLELYDHMFHETELFLSDMLNKENTEIEEKILKYSIISAIKIQKFDKAKQYIERRKQLLPVLKQHLGILDDIAYKKAMQLPYLEDLLKVLKDIIPDQVKIFCLEELLHIYKEDHHYEMALNSLYSLYEFDLRMTYVYDEIELLTKLERYEDVLKITLDLLHRNKEDLIALLALVDVYIKKGDYHKASTLEAEYEDKIDAADELIKKRAYELFVLLYQKMDNKLSFDLYQKKLKSIQKLIDKKGKIEPEKKEVIIIENAPKQATSKHTARHMEISEDIMKYSHLIDEKLLLREYFRLFFMHVESYVKAKDYIVYTTKGSPNLFHYKKERLYDKTIHSQDIEHSIISLVEEDNLEIFDEPQYLKYDKNIITQKPFAEDIKYVYAFPIGDLGVFMVHLEEIVSDPAEYYDLFKMISTIILTHLMDEQKLYKMRTTNHYYQEVLNSPIFAYRKLTEFRSTYNDQAQTLFNIGEHDHLELFLRDISYEYVHHYEQTIQKLFMKPGRVEELLYRYQEKHILEKLYSLKIGDEIIIMSVFFDQSKEVNETKDLMEKATIDQETGLSNLYALQQELHEEIRDKASLFLIELDHSIKHIYGTDQMSLYFKEFAQHTKKWFSEGKTYRFDFHQLMVIVPSNDIRTVTKLAKDYFRDLNNYHSKVLPYEKFDASMGILRYPVVTTEKNPDKLYRYLDIALSRAKREKEESFVFFVYRDYEDELFEQQVIDHLNIAIEQKTLSLTFNQITDLDKNRVWQYESELSMPNLSIDNKYLIAIAKKRNRLIDLEKYHFKKVCEFLVELEKETERLIKLTIPISRETFLEPTFNSFVLGLLKSYHIPYEFIRIKFDMDLRASHYAPQIQELIDHGIGLDTTSLDMALNYPFHALHVDLKKSSEKYHTYLLKVKELLDQFHMALVIRNVKTKEQKDALEKLGIHYIEGPLYKQMASITLIEKVKESL